MSSDTTSERRSGALDVPDLVRCFSVLSHDLKSPIFTIDGFSDLVLLDHAEKIGEEGTDFLQRIRASAAIMRRVIERMNAIVKLLSRDPKREMISIPDLLDELRLNHNYLLEDGELTIADSGDLPSIEGDREMIKEMLSALLVNAVVFNDHPAGERRVELSVSADPGTVRFAVRDNGIGLDPRFAHQVFELGTKMDKSRGEGPGYGLFMARKVAQIHGGTIDVSSAPSSGSTFTVSLPR